MSSLSTRKGVIIEGRKSIDLDKADKNASVYGYSTEKGVLKLRNISVKPTFSRVGKELPSKRFSCGIALYKNCVYVIGGRNESGAGSLPCNEVFKLDLNKPEKWKTLKPMKEKRVEHAVTSFRGKIYATGGTKADNQDSLKSVEAYDPVKDEWTKEPDLYWKRGAHALVVCKGFVYALGGNNASWKPRSEVERYQPGRSEWEVVTPMRKARDQLSATCLKDHIYALGGSDEKFNTMSSVEFYNPESEVWMECAPLLSVRCNFSSIILQNKIHIVGGWDECVKPSLDIDFYDPEKDQWRKTAVITDELLNCLFFARET